MYTTARSIRRAIQVLTLVSLAILWHPIPVSPQEDPLLRAAGDQKMVAMQIKAALPRFERGLALLTSSTDPESTEAAIKLLHDTYRYLRVAQERSEVMQRVSKFPDPTITVQNKQIDDVRTRLLACWGNRTSIAELGPIRTTCIEGLEVGIRKLRMVVVTLP